MSEQSDQERRIKEKGFQWVSKHYLSKEEFRRLVVEAKRQGKPMNEFAQEVFALKRPTGGVYTWTIVPGR